MFIITIHYLRSQDEVDDVMPQHIEFVQHHFANGFFICYGQQVPDRGSVLIARGESREQVESVMCENPFYQTGVGDFTITEFTPVLYSQQFSALMD